MQDIIKEIFMSDTCGVEKFKPPQSRDYVELNKKEDMLYGKLKAALSPELFEIFTEFLDTVIDVRAIISEQYYTAGFKIGLRLAMETFNLSDIFQS